MAAEYNRPKRLISPSNSMLECGRTTPCHYPEKSGFGGRREREWGHRPRLSGNKENPFMRIYVIGNDGITPRHEPPAELDEGEIVVAANDQLHAAQLSGKRLLTLWNALPGVEKTEEGWRPGYADQS